eukprot:GHVR01171551.1.p1 GENE.GHVR01171551.1~~GHVR01171551.1.p1  ORF type:complete len:380 (+),score=96.06 GHVR01171551.1:27-1166(+)
MIYRGNFWNAPLSECSLDSHVKISACRGDRSIYHDWQRIRNQKIQGLEWTCSGTNLIISTKDFIVVADGTKLTEERTVVGSWSRAQCHPLQDTIIAAIHRDKAVFDILDLRVKLTRGQSVSTHTHTHTAASTVAAMSVSTVHSRGQDSPERGLWSDDGIKFVLSDKSERIQVFDVRNLSAPTALAYKACKDEVFDMTFADRGSLLVAATVKGYLEIYDGDTLDLKNCVSLKTHTAPVRCVCSDPRGRWIASGSDDCTVCILDTHTLGFHGSFCATEGSVDLVSLSHDGSLIAWGGSKDSKISVGGAVTGVHYFCEHLIVDRNDRNPDCAFSPRMVALCWHPKQHTVIWGCDWIDFDKQTAEYGTLKTPEPKLIQALTLT